MMGLLRELGKVAIVATTGGVYGVASFPKYGVST
jgi:hypothetical protein